MLSKLFRRFRIRHFAQSDDAGLEENKEGDVPQMEKKKKKLVDGSGEPFGLLQKLTLVAGPALFAAIMFIPAGSGFTYPMKTLVASVLWIAVWWITESIPIAATSLLPLVLFPAFSVISFEQTAAGYANNVVFLFMGGFMLAVTMQRWNLHRRLALTIVKYIGTNPARLILGFMVATGFLSMWISNTATVVMMMPVGLAVIKEMSTPKSDSTLPGGKYSFGTTLMLGIAYAASIGGIATLIGSPPNAIFASVAGAMYGVEITFTQWFLYGFPIAIIFLMIAWVYLMFKTSPSAPGGAVDAADTIKRELQSLGPVSKGEKLTAGIFLITALAWIFRSLFLQSMMPFLSDALIAMIAVLLMFVIPVDIRKGVFLLDWDTAVKIPWGILLLFGGGIAIANGFVETGFAEWLGQNLSIAQAAPLIVVLLIVVTVIILLSNVTSNTGTISMMLPVAASLAAAMSVNPFSIMIAATTAVSFVFMLPVGTPPNAVVFGSGHVTIPQMAKVGLILTIISIVIITLIVYYWLPIAWGI